MSIKAFLHWEAVQDDSNLTELNATDSVNTGFMDHADWLAHVTRYAIVMKYAKSKYPTTILDVGCGRFPLLTYLWRNRVPLKGVNYVGLDLRAKKTWLDDPLPDAPANIILIKTNVVQDRLDLLGMKFDFVVCTEMLEHIDQQYAPELLRRLRFWIKDNGLMFLSSPNLGGSDTVAANHKAPDGTPREWTFKEKVQLIEEGMFHINQKIGTFITLDRIPEDFWNNWTMDIKAKLPNSFFLVFAAAPFPEYANNAMFVCSPINYVE